MNISKKFFTLIELITVIVILSILAAIVIPNIGQWTGEATKTAVENNMRNLQTAVDKYKHDKGDYPTENAPTLYTPEPIYIGSLYPKYIKSKPEVGNYWVDTFGRVWGSTVDAPTNISYTDKNVIWDHVDKSESYQLFMIQRKGSILSKIFNRDGFSLKELPLFKNSKGERVLSFSKEEEEYLVSAVDEFGLPTAPVGEGYEGFPIMTDDFIPFPLDNLGTYYVTTNAGANAKWLGIEVKEDKPEGTDIVYSFATSDDGKKFTEFVSEIAELNESKYVKVKVELKSVNQNKPKLYRLKMKFKRIGEQFVEQDFFSLIQNPEGIQIYNNNNSNAVGLAPNQTNGSYTQVYPLGSLSYVKDVQANMSYPTGTSVQFDFQTSIDGVNYSEATSYPETLPQGNFLKVTTYLSRESTSIATPLVSDLFIQTTSVNPNKLPNAPKTNLDKFIVSDNWVTVDKMDFIFDAGDIGRWKSIEKIDEQPEKTRILYLFSTSNDEISWSEPITEFEKLNSSVFLNVTVVLQMEKDAKTPPRFYEVIVDYELEDGTAIQKSGTSGKTYNIQQAVDKYYQVNNSYPTTSSPDSLSPAKLDFSKLYPNYLSYVPSLKTTKFWVDYQGLVWTSTVDAPQNIQVNGSTLSWSTVENAVSYKIYQLPNEVTGSLTQNNLVYIATVNQNSFVGKSNSTYVVSAVDEHGNQSAPSGKGYIGFINQLPKAVISMSSPSTIYTISQIGWDWRSSSDPDGDKVVKAEWKVNGSVVENPPTTFEIGTHKVELRVQDLRGGWSEWVNKTFNVVQPVPYAPVSFTKPTGNINLGSTVTVQWGQTTYWGYPATNPKYRLEVSYNGGAYSLVSGSISSNSYNHTVTLNKADNNVKYRIRAESDGGVSSWTYSNTFTLSPPPAVAYYDGFSFTQYVNYNKTFTYDRVSNQPIRFNFVGETYNGTIYSDQGTRITFYEDGVSKGTQWVRGNNTSTMSYTYYPSKDNFKLTLKFESLSSGTAARASWNIYQYPQ